MIVSFTIGCWDLLHHGHENHLQIALDECELLYVGIVTDWLVKMQKGCLPAQNYERRKEALQDFMEGLLQNPSNKGKGAKFVEVDCLHQGWISKLVDVAFVGEEQLDRFYAAKENRAQKLRIIQRTEGISSTMLRALK